MPALGGGVLQSFTTVDLRVIDPALGFVEFSQFAA
jgi:hypothetical protein